MNIQMESLRLRQRILNMILNTDKRKTLEMPLTSAVLHGAITSWSWVQYGSALIVVSQTFCGLINILRLGYITFTLALRITPPST